MAGAVNVTDVVGLVEEASVNSTKDSLDMRDGKKIKNAIKEIT
jgi:hypothetical protein